MGAKKEDSYNDLQFIKINFIQARKSPEYLTLDLNNKQNHCKANFEKASLRKDYRRHCIEKKLDPSNYAARVVTAESSENCQTVAICFDSILEVYHVQNLNEDGQPTVIILINLEPKQNEKIRLISEINQGKMTINKYIKARK